MVYIRVKRKLKLLILSIVSTLFLVLVWSISVDYIECSDCYNETTSRISIENTRQDIQKKYYTILEYTKITGGKKFCVRSLDDTLTGPFKSDMTFQNRFLQQQQQSASSSRYHYLDKCEYKNCFFTCNHEHESVADALIFHYGDFAGDALENRARYRDLIEKRKSSQIWMLWNDEAASPKQRFDYFRFNWSVTYYKQSEVSNFAYGGYTALSTSASLITQAEIRAEFEKRINSAIWFVSNCASKLRIRFTSRLAKYFPVTVNGDCSSSIRGSKATHDYESCARESKCETQHLLNNKFYLAFESINCSDYITEKFWRSLSYGLIPVVLQPSRQSYERVAPPDSFIHAADFAYDAEQLAEYLDKVSTDYNLYSKHLKWKLQYESYYKAEDVEMYRICQMCTKLNEERSSIYYESISTWSKLQCKKA